MRISRQAAILLVYLLIVYGSSLPFAIAQTSSQQNRPLEKLPEEAEQEIQRQQAIEYFQRGEEYSKERQYLEAVHYYRQAVVIFQELQKYQDAGRIQTYIGDMYLGLNQYKHALQEYEKAQTLAQNAHDPEGEVSALNGIALMYRRLGDFTRALECNLQALNIASQLPEAKKHLETHLINLGGEYLNLGHYKDALSAFYQALDSVGETDQAGAGSVYISLGVTYARLGNYQEAAKNFQKAQEMFEVLKDSKNKATALVGMGLVDETRCQENPLYCLRAIDGYRKAQKIYESLPGTELRNIGLLLHNIGEVYAQLGRETANIPYYQQALQYYQQARSITERLGDRSILGRTLNNIGEVYIHLSQKKEHEKNLEQALTFLHKALTIQQTIKDRPREWITHSNLGQVYEQQENPTDALNAYQHAIQVMETLFASAAGSHEIKTTLGDQAAKVYQQAIRLLARLDQEEQTHKEQAFELSEQARARAFLDQLGNLHPEGGRKLDQHLRQQEQNLRLAMANFNKELREQLVPPVSPRNHERIQQVEARLKDAQDQYQELLRRIQSINPEYGSFLQVAPLRWHEVQTLLKELFPDQETTLLAYIVTEDTTLAFIISPAPKPLEMVELPIGAKELNSLVMQFRNSGELAIDHLTQLYSILIKPLKHHLTTRSLGIIPHGILHYLPFAALYDRQKYLNDAYTLYLLPSASVLKFIGGKRKSDKSQVLALGYQGNPPLAYVQKEVHAIAQQYETQVLIGKNATESAFRTIASNFSILHLAAHGQLNTGSPLFSRIMVASDQEQDGMLEVHEVYELNLVQTDLVVLSACDTQLGRQSRGDDIIGLTRAFMYAGTSSVIASLWKVDDYATYILMKEFYTHLKRGNSKAEALQLAQQKTRAQFPHPYDWAAFVLTGDPGTTSEQGGWSIVIIIILIAAVGLVGVTLRKLKIQK